MSVIGIGVDLVECARIQRSIDRFGDRFLHRVFTDGEIEYSMSMKFPARHLAARFAGKEAVSKAFGTGIGKAMGWRNIDIRKKESGAPFATVRLAVRRVQRDGSYYSLYRQDVGRAILLGLEFLIAGDLIRTVVVAPTMQNVLVLGLIVLIRTFLSFSLQLEIEGKLPWRRDATRPD